MTQSPAPEPQIPSASNVPAVYQPTPMLEADARLWAMLVNLAAVAGAVLSGGTMSIAAVLVIWLIYRERSALVDFHGKQQLNVGITVLLAGIAAVIGILITFGVGAIVIIPLMIAYGIFVIVVSIIAAVEANKGQYYRIPLVIRFIK